MSAAIQLSLIEPTPANDAARATALANDTRPRLRAMPTLDLFSGPALAQPAPQFQAHTTTRESNEDGGEDVVVRLRVISEAHVAAAEARAVSATDLTTAEWMAVAEDKPLPLVVREPLVQGPLTYAECLTWEEPCGLLKCRHRLDYATEKRTRVTDADGAVVAWGDWCALRVATHDPGEADSDREKRVAQILGLSVAKLRAEVSVAVSATQDADYDLALEDHYGTPQRRHCNCMVQLAGGAMCSTCGLRVGFTFEVETGEITAKEAHNAVVPGELPCRCDVPTGDKGKTCRECGFIVPRGRMAPTVRGRKRSRTDAWAGVVRRVPDEFTRADGSTVTTVSAAFLEPARAKEIALTDYGMARMLAARGKTAADQ